MSNEKLFIPERVNVGYQNRNGTYTGKLAYIIYFDKTGTLRKEKSWNSWRDNKIPNNIYDNVPTDGFVLNKGVGGTKYHWNHRNEYIRVYDPRGFEFEISVANLLFILQESSCIKGKGLEGKFVYSWSGTELVLLPANSYEYKASTEYTDLQGMKLEKSDVIPGYMYKTKDQKEIMYLGRLHKYEDYSYDKFHVFYSEKYNNFIFETKLDKLALKVSNDVLPNFSDVLERYQNSEYGKTIVDIISAKVDKPILTFGTRKLGISLFMKDADELYLISHNHHWRYGDSNRVGYKLTFKKGNYKFKSVSDGKEITNDDLTTKEFYNVILVFGDGTKQLIK